MKHLARAALVVAVVVPAFACTSAPEEAEDSSSSSLTGGAIQGTVFGTGSDGLAVRQTATRSAAQKGSLSDGAVVSISCQVGGESIQGTTVWDYVDAKGGFVSDAYVRTGYDGFVPGVKRCAAGGSESGGGGGGGGGGASSPVTVDGPAIRSHVQSFAESACGTVGACRPSTYFGHQPSADLALDILISDAYGQVPSDGNVLADRLAAHALANQAKYRIWYVILRQRINYGSGWTFMEDRGSITQNHYDHVHVSFYP